ncbi:MAG: DsbA family protein [Gammaproteobacteria bacterium]|nr:DsbA family protein [Gammaproteobacteria bacterium]
MPQYKDQGGLETMDPSGLQRWAISMFLRRLASGERVRKKRAKAERRRRKAGRGHVIEYFHQVDDGYSHLAVQLLRALLDNYDVQIVCHLVSGPHGKSAPEPELLLALSRYDAAQIAPHFGLSFPAEAGVPGSKRSRSKGEALLLGLAQRILAGLDNADFPDVAPLVGEALWAASPDAMAGLARRHPPVDPAEAEQRIAAGDAQRSRLGHYSGAMFYYGGEWYWGVDRMYHLEHRLCELGIRRVDRDGLAPRPSVEAGPRRDDGSLTLEIYPSARSPYTAAVFDAAVGLARDTGVNLRVRPVLPMVMRGLSVPRQKGMYIFSDSSREAHALAPDKPWGKVYDPIGKPVRRCYSLYPWAESQGRGAELLSAFMHAAFRDGVNTGSDKGMRRVVEAAGLSWPDAEQIVDNADWEDEIERNRAAMYEVGLWGVPSFHLIGKDGETLLAVWGQDRLWLVSRAIQKALSVA